MISDWRTQFRLKVPRNQSRALVECNVGPGPLKRHRQTVAEADQKQDVDKSPNQPGGKAAQMQPMQIGNSLVFAYRSHASFIPVPKPQWFPAFQRSKNILSGV